MPALLYSKRKIGKEECHGKRKKYDETGNRRNDETA